MGSKIPDSRLRPAALCLTATKYNSHPFLNLIVQTHLLSCSIYVYKRIKITSASETEEFIVKSARVR
jgi:hypothetical protein